MPALTTSRPTRLPPAWFKHLFWRAHRALHRISGGRFLWTEASKRGWGAMRVTATGRRSGQPRTVIIAYLPDGPDLVALAMNGWDDGHPAWWRNVEAHPHVEIQLAHQRPRRAHARLAVGEERNRLWQRWREVDHDLDAYAAAHVIETPVVVFEPEP